MIRLIKILWLLIFPFLCYSQQYMMLDRTTASGGGSFDADFQVWLDELDTEGYTAPGPAQQEGLNQLVLDLKEAGVWDGFDLLYIHANDGSEDASRINFVAPGNYSLTDANSTTPSWTANEGVKTNSTHASGGDGWYNSNFDPDAESATANYQLNDASIGVFIGGDATAGPEYYLGQFGTTSKTVLYTSTTSRIFGYVNEQSTTYKTITQTSDNLLFAASRDADNSFDLYYDSSEWSIVYASNTLTSNDLMIGAMGSSSTTEAAFSPSEWTYLRISFVGAFFTSTEMGDIEQAFADYCDNYL